MIVVSGSHGSIGYPLVTELINRSFDVIGVDLNNEYHTNIKDFSLPKETKYVFHLASSVHPRNAVNDIQNLIDTNIIATKNLIEQCKDLNNCKLIYFSSSEVYGSYDIPIKDDFSLQIETNTDRSIYANCKVMGETIVNNLCKKYNLKYNILRLFNTFSYRFYNDDNRIFPMVIKSFKLKEPVPILFNGKHKRCYSYVTDIVHMILNVALSNINGTFNICASNTPQTVLQFIETIEKSLHISVNKQYITEQNKETENRQCNCFSSRYVQFFGKPNITNLEDAIIDAFKNVEILRK